MNILVVQESDWIEKGPHTTHHLFERLSKKGHRINVIDFEISWRNHKKEISSKRKVFKNQHKAIKEGNITVIRPPIIKLPILEYLSLLYTHRKEIKRQIADFHPDVIIGFGILNANIAGKLAKKKNIPFVYYLMDSLNELVPQKIFKPIARIIESKNMKLADKVISLNECLREYTIKLGADIKKTEVIRSGIDLSRYNPKIKGDEIREKYGIKDYELVLFFMGWLYDFSGLKEVAVELLKYKNIKILIVGEGDAYKHLKKISKEAGDRIILTGKQPYEKIPEFISASDVCLLPAHNNKIMRDIVPIKMYEYMAMEKPVISTKLPGVILEFEENNGVLYVDKPEDVVEKALKLDKKHTIKIEGKKARKFVERMDWSLLVDKFEESILEGVNKKSIQIR
ncbi:MAG: glycosyltransferase family 4 protein [Candidatus Aenigmarchaeota archaeon]|nr:glycosyltransferase family 4 protein [Candidatus Aenigmarchaeota archaeon]